MKVAQKVIFLFDGGDGDGDGLSTAICGGLHPNPSSNFQIRSDSFEFPLERYGIKDRKAAGEILHHVNGSGFLEVSILLLQNYEPPILACAMNEVLLNLAGDGLFAMPTLIAPFIIPESKLKQENKYLVNSDKGFYGIKLGPTTDVTHAFSSKLQKPPPSLQIHNEELALLIHLVNFMKFPAFVLVGRCKRHVSNKTSREELQVIYDVGEHLANVLSLNFSKETIPQNSTNISRDCKEAWHALYG